MKGSSWQCLAGVHPGNLVIMEVNETIRHLTTLFIIGIGKTVEWDQS